MSDLEKQTTLDAKYEDENGDKRTLLYSLIHFPLGNILHPERDRFDEIIESNKHDKIVKECDLHMSEKCFKILYKLCHHFTVIGAEIERETNYIKIEFISSFIVKCFEFSFNPGEYAEDKDTDKLLIDFVRALSKTYDKHLSFLEENKAPKDKFVNTLKEFNSLLDVFSNRLFLNHLDMSEDAINFVKCLQDENKDKIYEYQGGVLEDISTSIKSIKMQLSDLEEKISSLS